MADIEDYIPISEVAVILGVGRQHARKLCLKGKLPGAVKMGRDWLIPRASVENYTPGPQGFAAHPELAAQGGRGK